jgi:hypothetical protein
MKYIAIGHCDSNSASEKGNGSGSIRENSCNLRETLKKTKLTPPSQKKLTHNRC